MVDGVTVLDEVTLASISKQFFLVIYCNNQSLDLSDVFLFDYQDDSMDHPLLDFIVQSFKNLPIKKARG